MHSGERYPDVELTEELFVVDRQRMTCAGGVACLDMMLHDIQLRHGESLAAEVAEQVIYTSPRDATKPQKSPYPGEHAIVPRVLRKAVELMEANVERTMTIPKLSELLGLSQRQLERLFNKHYGCSAVAFYRRVRLLRARGSVNADGYVGARHLRCLWFCELVVLQQILRGAVWHATAGPPPGLARFAA